MAEPDPNAVIPNFPTPEAMAMARKFAGVTVGLHSIAVVVFGARMWSRLRPHILKHELTIPQKALILTNTTLLLTALPYAFTPTPQPIRLSTLLSTYKNATIAQPIWAWSMVFIKLSFTFMLLRIQQSLTLKRFLYAMIAVQLLLGIYTTLALLLQCRPYYKAWDLLGNVNGSCWPPSKQAKSSIAVSVVHILTDFMLALLPLSFLSKIQRPLRERVVVGVLMGLGFFAGVASIIKIVAAVEFGRATSDPTAASMTIGMWSVIEELVGFIVICVPCLRSPFQRVLHHCGLLSSRIRQHTLTRGYESKMRGGPGHSGARGAGSGGRMRSQSQSRIVTVDSETSHAFKMKELGTRASDEDEVPCRRASTNESCSGKGEIWCTKEVVVEHDPISRLPSCERMHGGSGAAWRDEAFDFDLGRSPRV
ncbi:hypothetical protein BDW02DRAFT_492033 [Decorospora gaudefroyi]|uniref:Rhodopsin domain-containing protein n=1 Tax=Decorospora gaudefroyi TaxID=184978 RepID=A0A6A5KRT5_9PLEO|nr:hypothetical protein BDW02DRAFT_492033 [Decorospora gaudefroyi]